MRRSWLAVKRHNHAPALTAAKGVVELGRFGKLSNQLGRNVNMDAFLAPATAGFLPKGMVVSTRLWHGRSVAYKTPFVKQGMVRHGE